MTHIRPKIRKVKMGKTQLKNETILSLKMQLMECQRCVDMPDCLHAGHACSCSDFLCADFIAPAYGMTLTRKARTVLFALCSFLQFITFPVAAETQADDDYDITSVEIVEEYCCDETETSWPQEEENNVLSLANLGNIFEPGQENQENVCLILPKTCPKYRGGCEEGKYCLPTCYYENIDAFGCALKTADPAYIAEQTGENGGQWTCHCDPEDEKEWNETARWCCPILGELGMCQTYATDEHGCSMIVSCTEGDDCSGCDESSSSSNSSSSSKSSSSSNSTSIHTSSNKSGNSSRSVSTKSSSSLTSSKGGGIVIKEGSSVSSIGHSSSKSSSSKSSHSSSTSSSTTTSSVPTSSSTSSSVISGSNSTQSSNGGGSTSSSGNRCPKEETVQCYTKQNGCCIKAGKKTYCPAWGELKPCDTECSNERGKEMIGDDCVCNPAWDYYAVGDGCSQCDIAGCWHANGLGGCQYECRAGYDCVRGECVSIGVSDVSHVSQPGVSENVYTSDVGMSNMNASDISSSQIGY